jgi:hypothetical protein
MPEASRQPRFRYSLGTLFFLTTIVAMAFALWRLNAELVPLRREVAQYRQQLGLLTIPESEKNKIHAITVKPEHSHEWRYRIYLPEGHEYSLHIAVGTIPARNIALSPTENLQQVAQSTSGGTSTWESGEFLLTFRVRPAEDYPSGHEWTFESSRTGVGPDSSTSSTTLTIPWMADERLWSSSGSMVNREQKSWNVDEPLRLLTVKRAIVKEGKRGGYTVTPRNEFEEADGFMLWIQKAN